MKVLRILGYIALLGAVFGSFFYYRSCKEFKARMAGKDAEIQKLNENIKESLKNEEEANKKSDEWKEASNKWMTAFYGKEEELTKVKAEKKAAIDKVKNLTPNELVLRTQEVLVTTEIELKPVGIVFSELAARINLQSLEELEYLRVEYPIVVGQKNDALNSVMSLKLSLEEKDKAYAERGIQLLSKDAVIKKVEEKLALEKQYGKSKAKKAFFIGAGVGLGVAVLISFLGGK